MSLCPECADLHNRWLDYQWGQPYTRWREGFGPRETTLSLYNLESRWRERRNLIRQQRAAIKASCEQHHQQERLAAAERRINGEETRPVREVLA